MKAITIVQKKEYLAHKGNRCPICGSTNIEAQDHDWNDGDGQIYEYCVCHSCKVRWTDTYQIVDVELDEELEDD